ncbi:MAG: (Fe-S)-binding protein [Burkholderiales bacterium]|jgi:Fe-S oxidoreductase|nr:(Fe-S)-binding protein [Burkholderiales bacterium]
MGPVAVTLLMLVAFAAFGWFSWRKLSIVASLQPEVRWDEPGARMKRVLVDGFLQSRMIRGDWKPGVMHTVIFLGFLTLLLRKIQLLIIGYHEPFTYPGAAGGAFAALKDVVEVAVLAAVAYGFWRRFVVKPARFEPNREALLVLGLIASIMVTDFLYDGFRFALLSAEHPGIAHERPFAFVGDAIARQLEGLPEATLRGGYHAFYWIQLVTVFSFLVILPLGEHFHIVTALPTLFFGKGEPTNRVPSVDLRKLMSDEGGEDMKVGAKTVRDLTWKEGLDAFTCTECGRCKDACPTFLTGKPLALKWVHDGVKKHLLAERDNILAAKDDALPPLVGAVIAEEALWACTTCGYCESACPIELEHLGKFYRLRQHRVMMDGEFPHELKNVFDAYEATSNPWGLPPDTRADWAKGLDVPVASSPEHARGLDYLFYVGSAESFDPRGQKIARAFVEILNEAGVRFAILGNAETSTGECVRRAGNEMLFQSLAEQLVGTLAGLGVTRIVTCDPHAFNSLRNEYPEFGGKYEVVHHTQLIDELVRSGRIRLSPSFERVIYHEPCYLGRHNGEYEAPRAVIAKLAKDAPLEFPLAREKAMCCGAGGGRMWMEETLGKRINITRVEQALPQAPKVIATACPYCAVMMEDALAVGGHAGGIATRDIAELVAEGMVRKSAGAAA